MHTPDFDSNDDVTPVSELKDSPLSERVRTAWIEEVRRYHLRTTGRVSSYVPGPRLDGGRDAHGRRFTAVWPKLAEFIIKHGVDPVGFVKAQFKADRPPLNPSMLLNTAAIERYRKFSDNKEFEREVMLSKEVQTRAAAASLEYYRKLYKYDTELSYKAMLLDDSLGLSSLYRYCVAKLIGEEDVAALFLNFAAMQYSEGPAVFDTVYKDWITDELRIAANDVKALNAIAGGRFNEKME